MTVVCFVCLLALLCPVQSFAEDVVASVDKNAATLEDQIVLTVTLSGERSGAGSPVLPPLPEFNVAEGGSSRRVEIVNFRKSSSTQYTYYLLPKRTGTFTIGPVRVSVNGKTLESRPIQVKILPVDQNPEESPAIFITQEVDVTEPYVNQQIVYTFRFFHRAQVVEAHWDAPAFDGYWVEDLGKEKQYETVLGGQRYTVTEIRKALFPTAPGSAEIPGCTLTCSVVESRQRRSGRRGLFPDDVFSDSFFSGFRQTVMKNLHAQPVPVAVRALPAEGQPPDFNGLVGTFNITSTVGDTTIRMEDSPTLTVTVEGTGNLRDLVEIGPEEIPGFKIFPSKPSLDVQIHGNSVESVRVFKKGLVPVEQGTLEIPASRISFFDPSRDAYQVARTDPIPIVVEKGEAVEPVQLIGARQRAGTREKIKEVGQDISFIHKNLSAARSQVPGRVHLVLFGVAGCVPPLAYLICLIVKRRRDRLAVDPHLARKREARKTAARELKEARRLAEQPEKPEFFNHLSRSVKGLIGDKLNLSAKAFTAAEIRKCLEQRGLPAGLVDEIHGFLESLEYSQYVSSAGTGEDRASSLRKAQKYVALLDRKL